MALTKITQADVNDKGVIGLPDTPNLSTQAMQEKFDEIALDVIIPKHNGLIDELEAGTAAASIGAKKNGEDTTVQDILDDMSVAGYTKAETDVLLNGKVDKEEGKVLSTNDFTDGFRLKLNGIEDNANNYVLPPATQSTLGGVMGDGSTFTVDENGVGHAVGGGGGGTADYEALINKPQINGHALIGDKDSEDYGILRPYVKVTSDAGSTVSIIKGTETITLTQVSGSTTEWEGYPTSYGTWTVKSVLSGADDATTSLTVDAVKTYAVTVNHISATITVTYPNGADCKLSKGTLEYTATTNPQTFTVRSVGTWTVTCTYNGIVKTATAIISANGDSQSVTIEYASIVVNYGNDFKGKTITCTDGTLTYTKVAPNDASSVTFTIPNTGSWTVSATVSGTPYSVTQTVSSYTSYTVTLEVFSATVTITFPYSNGATCSISDGDTTLTATESPMAFNIPNTGTWVATCTLDGQSKTQSFSITTDGQTESHTFEYGTINLTYANEFRGLSLSCSSGGTTITKTAPATGNTMVFYPPSTGTWTITGVYSGTTYSSGSITVSSLSTAVSATIQTLASITVTIYGAKQDTITFTDAAGTAHTVTFASGAISKSESLKIQPNGSTITFTSTVSKNPNNLSQNYTKNISLTTSTTSVYVMPNKVLYWYGNKVNITTTGYGGVFTKVDPTWNTQNATLTLSGSKKDCHFVANSAVSGTKAHVIMINNVSSANTTSELYLDSTYTACATGNTVAYTTHTGSGAPKLLCSSGSTETGTSYMTLYALWYE